MKLYSAPLSMFGAKAQIALLEKGIHFELEMVPYSLAETYRPKHPEVLRINPKGQVPVLKDGDLELFDSTQIFEYLEDRYPEPALWPRDAKERAGVRLLEHLADEVFFPHVATLMKLMGRRDSDEARDAVTSIRAFQARLDARLATQDYLAGNFTYAAIAVFMAQLFAAFVMVVREPGLARLAEWWSRVAARPSVRTVAVPMLEYLRTQGGPVPPGLLEADDGSAGGKPADTPALPSRG